ncbi:hemagglutinin, partial [Bacillus sp. FSL K6-2944]|uniref:hemagglutinin n=1 Tax=Bacillus sp. FSL K6-2944 TaxID=2921486 RepID=UPI0030FB0EDC
MPIDYKNVLKKMGLTVTATSLSVGLLSGCSLFGSEQSKKTDKKVENEKKKQEEKKKPEKLQEKDFASLKENAVKSQESNQNVAFVLDHMKKQHFDTKDKQITSHIKSSDEATSRVVAMLDQELSKSSHLNTDDVAIVASNSVPTETKDNQLVFGNIKDTTVASIGDVIPQENVKPPVVEEKPSIPPVDGGDKPKPPVDPPTDGGDKPKPPVDPPTDGGDKPKPPVDPPTDGGDKPKPPVDPPTDGG